MYTHNMQLKHVYLDFDGVLHPNFAVEDQLFSHMQALTTALEGLQVRIIISSSWRFQDEMDYLKGQFDTRIQGQVVGRTGDAHIGKWARWNEITQHAKTHHIKKWIALDDAYMEFPPDCKELILCDGRLGLQPKQLQQLVKWLKS